MAMEPWAFACHHLTTSHSAQSLVGPGGLSSLSGLATLVEDATLGRVVVSYSPNGNGTGEVPYATLAFPASDRLILGYRVLRSSFLGGGTTDILRIFNMNGEMLNIFRAAESSGDLIVRRGTTPIANMGSVGANAWHYIEIALYLHQSEGRIITRMDGVQIDDVSGISTSNVTVGGGATVVVFCTGATGTGANSVTHRLTDLYRKEWPNPAEYPPFWGPIAPIFRPVISTVSNDGWTASDGTIHDALQNDSAEYAEPTDGGDTVELELEPLPTGVLSVLGQTAVAVSTAPAGGSGLIGLDFKDGSDLTVGAPNMRLISDQAVQTSQAVFHETGPGGAPWTPTLANDANLLLTAVSN